MANATLLHQAFDQYACNNRTNMSQLIESALTELMTYPEQAYLEVRTICNGPPDKPTNFSVRYDPTRSAWQVGSVRASERRAMQFRSTEFVRRAITQMIRQNYCHVTVQTRNYTYHYQSSEMNLFK